MTGTDKKTDEKRFNETLKRMLGTRPKPHAEQKAEKEQESKSAKRKSQTR
jgi:hypothetical protein